MRELRGMKLNPLPDEQFESFESYVINTRKVVLFWNLVINVAGFLY